jgi:hypothetical protein
MTQVRSDLSQGIFDPSAARGLTLAYEKAEHYLDHSVFRDLNEIDRDRVARRIVAQAREGETQPDLVWRAAVALVLLERSGGGTIEADVVASLSGTRTNPRICRTPARMRPRI